MAGSSPPSFPTPHHETSYTQVNDQSYAAPKPTSIADMNARPKSVIQDQRLLRGNDGERNLERQLSLGDLAGGRASYIDSSNRAVTQDAERPYSIGAVAAANRHYSGTVDTYAYDEANKPPSNSDVRHIIHSSTGNQQGGYQYTPGPKSYNGDNFGRFTS